MATSDRDLVGRRIRAARVYSRLSRKQLAERLEVSERTEVESELGNRHVPRPELLAIAEACEVPMWFLERGWDGWQAEDVDDLGHRAVRDIEDRPPGRRAVGD